jgi:hypothetical protein
MYGLGVGEAVGRRGAAVNDFPALVRHFVKFVREPTENHSFPPGGGAGSFLGIGSSNKILKSTPTHQHNTTPTPVKIKLPL